MKIAIVGVGHVGSTIAYTLILKDLADEIVLIDQSPEKANSDAHDLTHAQSFTDHIIPVKAGNIMASKNSDVIIITASTPWKPQYNSRFDLGPENLLIFKNLIPQIARINPKGVMIIVSNPLDVMTYFAIRFSGFKPGRVLGVGTLIDSARFRKMLSEKYDIHPDDIRAYVLGEHGQTQFPALSIAFAGGEKISDASSCRELLEQSETTANEIVRGKGYTNFAIAMATSLIVESIYHDENRTMPISTLMENYLNEDNVCLSVPVVVGRTGIKKVLHPILDPLELKAFHDSAAVVRGEINKLKKLL